MIRALVNSYGQLQTFIPDLSSDCVASSEAGGGTTLNLAGLADTAQQRDGFVSARTNFEIAPSASGTDDAAPAGVGIQPPSFKAIPAGDLSNIPDNAEGGEQPSAEFLCAHGLELLSEVIE